MQSALDATALKLFQEAPTDTSAQLQTDATNYFTALFTANDATITAVSANFSSNSGSSVVVSSSVKVPTVFMQILGYNYITLNDSSTVEWGSTKLRVSLVLDNTGSMKQSGKLKALQTASHNLLTTLENLSQNAADVQVAIVPFANGVNVGVSNVSEPWIDWTYYTTSGGYGGWNGYGGSNGGSGSYGSGGGYGGYSGGGGSTSWSSGPGAWNSNNTWNGANTTCSWSSCWSSTGNWSGTTTSTNTSHWQGCVTDRDQDYDVLNTMPITSNKSTLFPAIFATSCPVALMGLSDDWTSLNTLIDAMVASGTTNQTIGLAWGWQALTPGLPFDNDAMPTDAQQVIILMTDGLNTENRWTTNQADIDARTAKACSNIKTAGITLYTVQVSTDGTPLSSLLQNCASDSSKFFYLTSANQLVTTFDQIGTDLSKLRIAE